MHSVAISVCRKGERLGDAPSSKVVTPYNERVHCKPV